KAAKELDYEPEWTARSLRLRKTNIIGVIIPNVADYFFSSIVLGVEKYFRTKEKNIILFNTSSNEEIEKKLIRLAIAKRVEGIVLATISKNVKEIEKFINTFEIPIVVVDNKIDLENVDFVLSDDVGGSKKLIEHLIEVHGIEKIACISGPMDESSGYDKLMGYKSALIDNGIEVNEDYIKVANWKKKEAYDATKELFSMKDKPRAIYCANANMLIGCLRYLNEYNINVPDGVAVITFDDYDYVSAFNPPVTALARIDIKMGESAASMLFERITNKNIKYRTRIISSDLIVRKSCGCK
ncbi:MAG: LacI family DNA-binding transcriptional regulator, partial [Actinomycetota bacterium]|nr:LacI family DNA-binding transcriptional regulator [Actinomycetota bacterium]